MDMTMNIMFVANKKYIFPMITLLYSIFIHNDNPVNLYLFHTDIDENTLTALKKYCSNWDNKQLIPIYVNSDMVRGLTATDRFPAEVYYKLLAIDLLPQDLDKILCMDLDMVVNKSLLPLFRLDITGSPLAACSCIYSYIFGEGIFNHRRLNIDTGYQYFNAGLMLLNLNCLRQLGGSMFIINHARSIAHLTKWFEQDVLNHLFYNKYHALNWYDYNCPPVKYVMKKAEMEKGIYKPLYRDEISSITSFDEYADYTQAICDNAAVIHYLGDTKPWNESRIDTATYRIFDRYFLAYSKKAIEIFELVNF